MSKTFVIGDTHFCHRNIIKYENRPFNSVEEMNNHMIKMWNNKVKKNDRIFVLGDFALGNKKQIEEITQQLNGHKILIMGNHDGYSDAFYRQAGFAEVYRYPIIVDDFFILSHEPMYINDSMPYANIFAHVHSNKEYTDFSSQSICVSVERKHMNYAPILLSEAIDIMDKVVS